MKKTLLTTLLSLSFLCSYGGDTSILDFGATESSENNALAIQAAIDACESSGGGTVHIPAGIYLSSTINLRTNVHLYIHAGGVLKGVTDAAAYGGEAFVYGKSISNSSIRGEGCIDGQGNHANFQFGDDKGRRPHVVMFESCRNMQVKDVQLCNSATWTLRLANCDGVQVHNVRIYSHGNHNCDGIDINSKNVVISGCIIDCDDDGICFKTDKPGFSVENVSITNCVIGSNCNGIKFGTGSFEAFRNISISNCVIRRASESNMRDWRKMMRGISSDVTVISGIALEVVDGGIMDQVSITNITMTDVQTPIFIRLGNRRGAGTLKNVLISNVIANSESFMTSSITGVPGSYVENVTLRDIILNTPGGADPKDADILVPEKESEYPENRMFGHALPAYGFYIRHVKNLTLENIQCQFRTPDPRPAFVLDDVHNLWLNNFQAHIPTEGRPILKVIESSGVAVSGFRTQKDVPLFMEVQGANTKKIDIRSNNFDQILKKASLDKQVRKTEIRGL